MLIPFRHINKWGYVNLHDELIIPCIYDNAKPFERSNFDLAIVEKDNKYAWIDRNGTLRSPWAWRVHAFNAAGISIIILEDQNNFSEPVLREFNCLFLNQQAEEAFTGNYINAVGIRDGLIMTIDHRLQYGVIDSKGSIIYPFIYSGVRELTEMLQEKFEDGYSGPSILLLQVDPKDQDRISYGSREQGGDKTGFKNEAGEIVIPAQFDWAGDFRNGAARVNVSNQFWHIDRQGIPIYERRYYYVKDFQNGLAEVVCNENVPGDPHVFGRWGVDYHVPHDARWGYIDLNGKEYWKD